MCISFVLIPTRLLLAATGVWPGWSAYVGDLWAALMGPVAGHKHLDLSTYAFVSLLVPAGDWVTTAGGLFAAVANATSYKAGDMVLVTAASVGDHSAHPLSMLLLPPLHFLYEQLSVQLLIEMVLLHGLLTVAMVRGFVGRSPSQALEAPVG